MTLGDWKTCYGEVFQIYRRSGPGPVSAGDEVGLYYPDESKWLGCSADNCGHSTCPGTPSVCMAFRMLKGGRPVLEKCSTFMLQERQLVPQLLTGTPSCCITVKPASGLTLGIQLLLSVAAQVQHAHLL